MKRVLTITGMICLLFLMSACGQEVQNSQEKEQVTSMEEASSSAATASGEESKGEASNAEGSAEQEGTTESGTEEEITENGASDALPFETVDINGNAVTSEILEGSKLVLLNFWEPWCGPCVREMPDLEKLYEEYQDQGLLILGVYKTFSMDDDAKEIVTSAGITYPILKADSVLLALEQNYVPATYLLDGEGQLLYEEPIAGARSYETWKEVVLYFMPE
ncbi:MAG: TlpA family protein disulfide reductase [Lachnospiraceae bacterium]|nr:TlpA family protein disulfide reductase [Lachnospiraceae bacterium]